MVFSGCKSLPWSIKDLMALRISSVAPAPAALSAGIGSYRWASISTSLACFDFPGIMPVIVFIVPS